MERPTRPSWGRAFTRAVLPLALALVAGGCRTAGAGGASQAPLIVFVVGDHEYSSEATMPLLAHELERSYGFRTRVLTAYPDQNAERDIPGLEALAEADLAVFYLRWRQLPAEQVAHIDRYLRSGKPVVGFRTSTHAFNYPADHPLARWNAFGEFALGAPPGWGNGHTHYGHNSTTQVRVIPEAANDPILTGVAPTFAVRSWLYHVLPGHPPPDARRLLVGRAVNPNNPNAVENPVAWTWRNEWGGRVFTTTLGHPEDFAVEPFQRLVVNGIHWALGRPVPRWAGKIDIDVPYRGM